MSAVSVNTYLRCVNAYFKWREIEWQLPRLKEEQRILATFNKQQIKALISFKPTGTIERRAYALAMLILDCGLRINEARTLTASEIDLDNMLVAVHGKECHSYCISFRRRNETTIIHACRQACDLAFSSADVPLVVRTGIGLGPYTDAYGAGHVGPMSELYPA